MSRVKASRHSDILPGHVRSPPLVCRFGALGDMVLMTPLLRLLYQRSGLPCDVVGVGGWNHALFAEMPWVRNVLHDRLALGPLPGSTRSQRELVKSCANASTIASPGSAKPTQVLSPARNAPASPAPTASTNSISSPWQDEHYCDKWLRLGNLDPQGFDAAPCSNAAAPGYRAVRQIPAEIDECRSWLQATPVSTADAPLLCIQAGSKRTMRRGPRRPRQQQQVLARGQLGRGHRCRSDRATARKAAGHALRRCRNESDMCAAIREHIACHAARCTTSPTTCRCAACWHCCRWRTAASRSIPVRRMPPPRWTAR